MYVCGVDTEELSYRIEEKIDRGLAIDRRTLGPLLGLPLDKCYDSSVWKALQRLIWYIEHENETTNANEAHTEEIYKDNQDHFTYDDITYPIHYAGNSKITCKDALNSMMCPLEAVITPKVGYWLGCAFKYLWRAFLKGDPKKDLLKCKQCIDEVLNLM